MPELSMKAIAKLGVGQPSARSERFATRLALYTQLRIPCTVFPIGEQEGCCMLQRIDQCQQARQTRWKAPKRNSLQDSALQVKAPESG